MSLVSKNYSDYFAILLDLIHDKPQRKYLMLTNVRELNVVSNVQNDPNTGKQSQLHYLSYFCLSKSSELETI